MANIALVTANKVEIVGAPAVQLTAPAGEAIAPGAPVRLNTSGQFVNGNATTTTENNIWGIATGQKAIVAGWPVTAVRIGILDGFNFADQDHGENIFLSDTDATLADSPGTTVMVVGTVVPGHGELLGSAPKKLLYVQITDDLAFLDTNT
ncbi:MAG: hypothetical protein KC442_10545 [Thermomicrobiales bacterium]|nr:hypothetical protein [Thermomicrobiales bacterium]MCB0057896.1 hypothetical protein [Caldilineaceae bacterium]